jgi:hypothetical protein
MGGFRTAEGNVAFEMFLSGTRLYIAKVESKKGVEEGVANDRKKFLDDFLFVHVDQKEKKAIWGLPKVKDPSPIAPDINNIHQPPA